MRAARRRLGRAARARARRRAWRRGRVGGRPGRGRRHGRGGGERPRWRARGPTSSSTPPPGTAWTRPRPSPPPRSPSTPSPRTSSRGRPGTPGALVVHYSTDYVFDGTAARPYREDDTPRPLGVYGASKLAGEHLVAAAGGEHLVVRTSGVFGRGGSEQKGGSFVERIVAQARAGQPLRVVADQVFAPTFAADLATASIALVRAGARGLFHVTNAGSCSWHDLAVAALAAGRPRRSGRAHPGRRPASWRRAAPRTRCSTARATSSWACRPCAPGRKRSPTPSSAGAFDEPRRFY